MLKASWTARSRSAGTLGQPEFNGDFHLREGRLELYRTNLIISNLVADGKFVGDQLTFDATGDTAARQADAGR